MHEIKWASCCLIHAIMQLVNYNFKPAVVHEKKNMHKNSKGFKGCFLKMCLRLFILDL